MTVFGLSRESPLHCYISQEKYDGEKINSEIPAMLFFDCNNGKERLELIDKMLEGGWYQRNQERITMEGVRKIFGMSEALFEAKEPSKQLLTKEGKINVLGFHGAVRRQMQMQRTYSTDCPICKEFRTVHQSRYINRQLKFGRIKLSKWEIVQLKIEEIADFISHIIDGTIALKEAINAKGVKRLGAVRTLLHRVDHYLQRFSEIVQQIMVLSLAIKGAFWILKDSKNQRVIQFQERVTKQINTTLLVGSVAYIWKGVIMVVDQDPATTLLLGGLLFISYVFGLSGIIKGILTIYAVALIREGLFLQRER